MATITRQAINSYQISVTNGVVPDGMFIRDVPDFIPIINRSDTPLIKAIKSSGTTDKLKMEYGQGNLPVRSVALTAAVTAGASTITVDVPNALQQYDVIRFVNGDQARVTAAAPANPVAVVAHPGGGTLNAHSNAEVVQILGPAVPEGADTPTSPTSAGDLFFNYPQIFEYSWTVTHRGRVTPNYEFKSDRFQAELKRKMTEATLDLESTALWGKKQQGDGSGTNPSTTDGLIAATTSNVVDVGGVALTLSHINSLLQTIATQVGQNDMGKYLVGNYNTKRIFNTFIAGTRRSGMQDKTMNITVDQVDTDFGTIKFVTHYNWPDGYLNIVNLDDIKRVSYVGGDWKTGLFSTQGWYDRGFLRGDFGFLWEAPDRRGLIKNFLAATTTNYPNLDKPV